MSRGRFLLKALLALVLVGLLVSTVAGILGMAWWRGYRIAQWTAEEGEEAVPRLRRPFTLGWPRYGGRFGLFSHMCGVWLLFKLVLLLLLISLVGRLFRRHAWGPTRGPWGMYGPWYWHHRRMHNWDREESFRAKVRSDGPAGDSDEG
jgi:hypothetical protein